MGVIRNTAAMQIRGKVGNTTYYVEGGRQIARVSQNGSNYGEGASRSEAQQFQRGKWGNLVNFYKVSKKWIPKAYESKKRTQSDYNRFMQLNTPNARVYLTRNMYANGGCVVDAFRISEGSLRPINVQPKGAAYNTDLLLDIGEIVSSVTVGEFSESLIINNNHIHEGMQISFISYQQILSSDGVPSLVCTAYEVTLDKNNVDPILEYLPPFCCQNNAGYLGTSDQISTGAFAYVLSETISGKTSVSTQTLIVKNAELLAEFTSAEAIKASIDSYGVDKDIFLTSGSYPVQATPQPVFLESIRFGIDSDIEGEITPGSGPHTFEEIFGGGGTNILKVSGRWSSLGALTLWTQDLAPYAVGGTRRTDGNITIGSVPSVSYSNKLVKVTAVLDGVTYSMDFKIK